MGERQREYFGQKDYPALQSGESFVAGVPLCELVDIVA